MELPLNNVDFFRLVVLYGECGQNMAECIRRFVHENPKKKASTRMLLRIIFNNLRTIGSCRPVRKDKVNRVFRNENLVINVLAFFEANPKIPKQRSCSSFEYFKDHCASDFKKLQLPCLQDLHKPSIA